VYLKLFGDLSAGEPGLAHQVRPYPLRRRCSDPASNPRVPHVHLLVALVEMIWVHAQADIAVVVDLLIAVAPMTKPKRVTMRRLDLPGPVRLLLIEHAISTDADRTLPEPSAVLDATNQVEKALLIS